MIGLRPESTSIVAQCFSVQPTFLPPRRSARASSSRPKSPSPWLTRLRRCWSSSPNPPDAEASSSHTREPGTRAPAAAFKRLTVELAISSGCVYPGSGACTTSLTRTRVRQVPLQGRSSPKIPHRGKTNFLLRDSKEIAANRNLLTWRIANAWLVPVSRLGRMEIPAGGDRVFRIVGKRVQSPA